MQVRPLTDGLSVAPQITLDDVAAAASQGFRSLMSNRPDGEDFGQPTAAAQKEIAGRMGMSYAHIPVSPGGISRAQVRAFQEALASAPGPVLAHCRSGMRSAMLWAVGEVMEGRMQPRELDVISRRIGIDLSGARNWLMANA